MKRLPGVTSLLLLAAMGGGLTVWAFTVPREEAPAGSSWRGLWLQDSRPEAGRVQLTSLGGDPASFWQLDPDGERVFVRYAREVLRWARPQLISIHVPAGRDRAREGVVLHCEPGPHPDYPEIDCAPPSDRTYAAANITIERLIEHGRRGIWIVTRAERTNIHAPAPASRGHVRRFVEAFLERRVRGFGAQRYLSLESRREFRRGFGRLGPLYRSVADFDYGSWEIIFIDGPLWPDGSFEVGVRLLGSSGPGFHEETLFVGPGLTPSGEEGPLLVLGGRWGVIGP